MVQLSSFPAQHLQIEGIRGATGWPQRHPHPHAEAIEHGAAHHQVPQQQFLGEPVVHQPPVEHVEPTKNARRHDMGNGTSSEFDC